jgi:hypothetical protein
MKYDSILYVDDSNIFENDRMRGDSTWAADVKGMSNYPINIDDPKMYNSFTFGRMVRNAISNMGNGWTSEVTDFKKWVVVRITYYNYETSRSSTKTFLIVFKHKGDGIIMSTHNRYRTIAGVDQAVSYIKSSCSALENSTQNRI